MSPITRANGLMWCEPPHPEWHDPDHPDNRPHRDEQAEPDPTGRRARPSHGDPRGRIVQLGDAT